MNLRKNSLQKKERYKAAMRCRAYDLIHSYEDQGRLLGIIIPVLTTFFIPFVGSALAVQSIVGRLFRPKQAAKAVCKQLCIELSQKFSSAEIIEFGFPEEVDTIYNELLEHKTLTGQFLKLIEDIPYVGIGISFIDAEIQHMYNISDTWDDGKTANNLMKLHQDCETLTL